MALDSIVKRIIRLGTVTAIYDETGYVQVTFFDRDDEPRDVPMFSFISEYNMPDRNDTVLCVFLPFCKDGFCFGKWFSKSNTPPANHRDIWFKKLRKKADVSFDDRTETLTINAKYIIFNGELLTVNANIQTAGTIHGVGTITSDVDCISNGVSGHDHTHPYTWTDPGGSGDTEVPNT